MRRIFLSFVLLLVNLGLFAENGHQLWLRNVANGKVTVVCSDKSVTTAIAVQELKDGWQGRDGATITLKIKKDKAIKNDGFKIGTSEIQANTAVGVLYGAYELLRR